MTQNLKLFRVNSTGIRMITFAAVLIIALVSLFNKANTESDEPVIAAVKPEIWGLEYGVSNLSDAVEFYTEALGFEIEDSVCCSSPTVLRNGELRLILTRSEAALPPANTAIVVLNMRVGDIGATMEACLLKGGKAVDDVPRPFALGNSLKIQDPSGNWINLLKLDEDTMASSQKPVVFNIGVTQENLETAERFYTSLGFMPFSRDYLPEVLPLDKRGAAALVLHGSAQAPATEGTRTGTLLLSVTNLDAAVHVLGKNGFTEENLHHSSDRDFASLRDPSGNRLKLLEPGQGLYHELWPMADPSAQYEWTALQENVWKTVEAYTEASHQRNLGEYLSFWHPDFLGWHNGDTRPTNHQQRAKGLRNYFDNTTSLQYELEPRGIQIIADGRAAIVHYELRNILKNKSNGNEAEGLSYWTDYLVREDGRWLLISDHGGSQ